uniref:Basic tail secreted protein n=1 Tax=Rhipicephalus appendiculatus TaxID=34631 RepID=A0A131YF86_RHIAP
MLLFFISAFFVAQVLVEANQERETCPPEVKGLVDNCNVWCPDGQDYVNIYYPNGTICKYDESHNGTCIEYAEGKTGCLKHEIGSDRNHGQISTKSKTKEDIGKTSKKGSQNKEKKKKNKKKKNKNKNQNSTYSKAQKTPKTKKK